MGKRLDAAALMCFVIDGMFFASHSIVKLDDMDIRIVNMNSIVVYNREHSSY